MNKTNSRKNSPCAVFCALITIGAFIRIPTPLMPVTLQVSFVILSGWLLGSKASATSALIYMMSGLLGLPVFTCGGGPGYIFQPTFGYILAFIPGTAAVGAISSVKKPNFSNYVLSGFVGISIIYLIGTLWFLMINELLFHTHIGLKTLLLYCILPTMPFDILLNFVGAVVALKVKSASEGVFRLQ